MKRNRKTWLSILLAVVLAASCAFSALGAQSEAAAAKLSDALDAALQTAGEAPVSVLITLDYGEEKLQGWEKQLSGVSGDIEAVHAIREAIAAEAKAQFQKKNEAAAQLLLQDVQVQYISPYSPFITITADAQQILEIAENPLVASIDLLPDAVEIPNQPAQTEQKPAGEAGFGVMADVGEDVLVNMIHNDYYKMYADELLREVHQANLQTLENGEALVMPAGEKMDPALLEKIRSSDSLYYLTVTFALSEPYSEQANRKALDGLDGLEETLYIGTTSPCALVCVKGAEAVDALLASEEVAYVSLGFTGIAKNIAVIPEADPYVFAPTTADARAILRYAVGLGAPENTSRSHAKKFFFAADTDLDGSIQTDDAREALRIAVGLSEGRTFTVTTNSFWER